MANLMELNSAAQARSDKASAAAKHKCFAALTHTNQYVRQDALAQAMAFDADRAAMFLSRFVATGDRFAFIDGICAIHGALNRGSLERSESPDNSPMIVGGTFGGIG